ncbi:MAG: FkbM family methyltransferase [Hyphomicrobiaceae bacterium]|nr:FkbM family methyltransferase [Hyphomicrobiaceae bacterium]
MQISYAQNLEDYHLDLVFGDLESGTYVDVGGGHPVADNVSFWFYLKGWRGLIVEPQEALAALYAHVRPRDHTVSCLAGRSAGEVDFHVVDKLHGFSTTVRANAAGAARFGAGFQTVKKPMRPLAALCDEARLAAIDFLKVDVEGAEAEVLAGMDFTRLRPRVVLVEAIVPGSMAAAWDTWEPILTRAGYRFAFFDNLNRFYVAEEAADLAQRFPAQPAPWDRVGHLWDCGRAPEKPEHPDHALAKVLVAGLMARLPAMPPGEVAALVRAGLSADRKGELDASALAALVRGNAEFPRPHSDVSGSDLAAMLQADEARAALGRIACMYDGGHLLE